MTRKELVEITVKVPKKLVEILEAEDYLGWKPNDFFEATIRSMIGMTVGSFPWEEMQKFYCKYGKDVDRFYLKSTKVVDC